MKKHVPLLIGALISGAFGLAGAKTIRGGARSVTSLQSAEISWGPQKISTPTGVPELEWIAADPASPEHLFALGNPLSGAGVELLRSNDSGRSWSAMGAIRSLPISAMNRVAVNSGAQDIAITTPSGAVVSSNGGKTFRKVPGMIDTSAASFYGSKDPSVPASSLAITYGGLDNSQGAGIRLFTREGDGYWAALSQNQQPESLTLYAANQITAGVCVGKDACVYSPPHTRSLEVDPNYTDVMYVGTGSGAFRWTARDGWNALAAGRPNSHAWDSNVYTIHVDRRGSFEMATCNAIYVGDVDAPAGPMAATDIHLSRVESPDFLFDQWGPLRVSPYAYRDFGVFQNPNLPGQEVTVLSTGVYLKHDSDSPWRRVQSGLMDDRETLAAGSAHEYRTAIWLPDGTVEVSGTLGTFLFKP